MDGKETVWNAKTTEGRDGQKAPRILREYFKLLRSSFPSDEGFISNIPNGNDWRIKVVHNFKSGHVRV